MIQIDSKSFSPLLMSVLAAYIIVGSSYALNTESDYHFYQSTGNYQDQLKKPIDGNKAPAIEFGLESSGTTFINNIHLGKNLSLDNQSGIIKLEFPSVYSNSNESCARYYNCMIDFTTGWKDNTSIQVSTNITKDKKPKIIGQEADVKPNARYEFVIHMKLNQWATQSRAALDGFNESSNRWYRIDQCPSASVNGPLDWQEFTCGITIEPNTTKVRSVLIGGWSSQSNTEAMTWFDSLYLKQFKSFLTDPNLVTQVVYQGLNKPISMAFLGPNDFLVSGKNGTIHRIVNGVETSNQSLHLDLAGDGILGISIKKNTVSNQNGSSKGTTYVFVHFDAKREKNDGSTPEKGTMINRLYRYEFVNNILINPKLLLELPCDFNHNGGPVLIGPDKQTVYFAGGDCENIKFQLVANKALNNKTGLNPDGTGGILRFTEDGKPVSNSILDSRYPANLYYAYGIRQIFGMDFDPVTGKLWDTENGENWGDEINLVEPGFNSGWVNVQGVWKDHDSGKNFYSNNVTYHPSDLVDFDTKGKYRSPEFVWRYTVGPTALIFLSSEKLGKEYKNDIFVGDVNNGRIYHFKLNQSRTGLLLEGPLKDKIADTDKELEKVVFAENFGIITDLKVGPDGYLYFVVYDEGKIYRVVPKNL